MKLTEQELSWDDAVNVISKPKPPVAPTSPKGDGSGRGGDSDPKGGGGSDPKGGGDSDQKDQIKRTKLTALDLGMRQIPVAIRFLESIGPASAAGDWDQVLAALKQLRRKNFQEQKRLCIYVDWILRISTIGSPPAKLAQKFRKQYDYVFTRNGKATPIITVKLIQSIQKHPQLRNLNSIFSPKTAIGQALNMDTNGEYPEIDKLKSDLDGIISYNLNFTESEFKSQRSAEAFNRDIFALYNSAFYEPPIMKYQTKF